MDTDPGSGPFELVDREPGEYLHLEAHEEYHETDDAVRVLRHV